MIGQLKAIAAAAKAATLIGIAGGLFAAGAAAALAHEHLTPWGLASRLDRMTIDRDRQKSLAASNLREAMAERGERERERKLRAFETDQAVAALTGADAACDARVAAARRSSAAINRLVEPTHAPDPNTGCPVRRLMPADGLSDALGPGPAAR